MNIDTLVDILFDAFIADSSILSWCNTNYSTPHTIYKGIDLRNPPDENDYPIITIWPISKMGGDSQEMQSHGVVVTAGINDSTLSTDTDTNLVVAKKYRGLARIEAFRKLVETSVTTEIGSNTNTTEIMNDTLEIMYDPVDCFPFFFAVMAFIFTKYYSQGDDVFE